MQKIDKPINKPCRHEYVKIFQRKYKGMGRRLVSTKGYLPVGFSVKDFSHLSEGSFCFCVGCRMRLFPARLDSAKLERMGLGKNMIGLSPILPVAADGNVVEDVWTQDSDPEMSDSADLKEVNVEELQIESIEVSDISDNKVIVSCDDDIEEEEGEE